MLTGVEVLSANLSDSERRSLLETQPDVVKVRRPGIVSEVLDVLPEARIIARSDGEGGDFDDMVGSYGHWRDTLDRYRHSLLTYAFANEPNFSGRNLDPDWWFHQAATFGAECQSPVPLCLPGLQPLWRTDEWLPALARLWDSGWFGYTGIHAYSQLPDTPAGVMNDLMARYAFVPPKQLLILEANLGHSSETFQPSQQDRADACATMAEMARQWGCGAFCVFSLGGPGWHQFTLSDDGFRQVFAAGRATPKRPRRPKPIPTEVVTMPTLADIQRQAYVTTMPDVSPDDVNDTTGLYDFWLKNKATLGTPTTGEINLDDGRVAQRFATGRILVYDQGAITVE